MANPLKELFRHSAIYGLGEALSRCASILLLPLYTSYLTPADYGVIALVESTTGFVGHIFSSGITQGTFRFHFKTNDPEFRSRIWTTGMFLLLAVMFVLCTIVILARRPISQLLIGDQPEASRIFSFAVSAFLLGTILNFLRARLRAEKKSVFLVQLSLCFLLLKIGLNIFFIAYRQVGLIGFFYSQVIAALCEAVILGLPFIRFASLQPAWSFLREMGPYAIPLIISGMCAAVMHQSDRLILRSIVGDMSVIGVYAIAYQLAQGSYSLMQVPFQKIWSASIYEIEKFQEGERYFREIYHSVVFIYWSVLLILACFAGPIVSLLTPPRYGAAALYLPWLCAGVFLFSLHGFYATAAHLRFKSNRIAAVAAVSAIANLVATYVLVYYLSALGAALASVATYGIYSGLGLWLYSRLTRLPFDAKTPLQLLMLAVPAVLVSSYSQVHTSIAMQLLVGTVAWGGAVLAGWRLILPEPLRLKSKSMLMTSGFGGLR